MVDSTLIFQIVMPTLATIGIIFAYLNWRKKSTTVKQNGDNIKRSAVYCAELYLVNTKNQNIKEALKYVIDLKNSAYREVSKDVDNLVEFLKFMMEKDLHISDEKLSMMEVLLHNISLGMGESYV